MGSQQASCWTEPGHWRYARNIELQNWPRDTLTLGRVERGQRVFHAVSFELMDGEVISEGAKHWQIESFFKESKHLFGLNRFALRTARGLDRWLLLVFVT